MEGYYHDIQMYSIYIYALISKGEVQEAEEYMRRRIGNLTETWELKDKKQFQEEYKRILRGEKPKLNFRVNKVYVDLFI